MAEMEARKATPEADLAEMVQESKKLEQKYPGLAKSFGDFRRSFTQFRQVQEQFAGQGDALPKKLTEKYKA